MRKKILITAGGTGGHIFPALTLAHELSLKGVDLLFVAGGLNKNKYFEKGMFPFKEVACGTFNLRKPLKIVKNAFLIAKGIYQSRSAIRSYQPDLVIGFGSYYTLPTLIASKLQRIPVVLHEANRIPGKVNRLFSPYAKLTGVHFSDTRQHLQGNVHAASLPLRPGYKKDGISREDARRYFSLEPHAPTLLVFGGSQGAQRLNKMVAEAIIELHIPKIQMIQTTGDESVARELAAHYAGHGISACVKAFESRMDMAWQAADLAICRAGAGTLSEQLEFEVPAILIPYPYAAENHQEANADFMVQTIAGAIKKLEEDLSAKMLADAVRGLLADGHGALDAMRSCMAAYKRNHPQASLCDVVMEILMHG